MSDRVESERSNQAAEAQKAAEQQSKKATEQQAADFKRTLSQKGEAQKNANKTQQAATQQRKGNQQQSRAKGEAQNALMARQGIASSQYTSMLQGKSAERRDEQKSDIGKQDKTYGEQQSSVRERDTELTQDHKDTQVKGDKLAAVERDDRQEKQPGSGGSSGGDAGSSGQHQSDQQPPGSGMAATGTTTAGTGGPAPTAPTQGGAATASARQVAVELANRIADKMATGMTADGRGMADVQLQQGVLSGSRLRVTYGQGGKVEVKFSTDDANIARLLSNSGTQQQLATLLKGKNMTLDGLTVERRT